MSGEQAYEVCAWEQGLLGRDTTIKGRIGWKGYTTDDLRNSGPWVIGGTSVNSVPRIGLETAKHLSREKYLESPEIQLKHGDLLVVTRGNLADVALFDGSIGEATINPSIVILSDFDGEPRFLFYYLISPIGRASLLSIASGSSVPAIYQADLKKLKYLKPPLPEQRRIAKILGDLDDKIELNRKMNETLEQMARALFKSWFVDFDPVRAKMEGRTPTGMDAATAALFPDRLVDSELGPIPEGWEVKALGEVIECVKGRSYRSEELAESTTALVTLKSFLRGGGYRPDGLKPFIGEYKSNQRVYPGDLVIALTDVTQAADVIGKPALIRSDKQFDTLVASLDVGIIRPTDEIVSKPFLYCLFMTESFQTHAYSHSTGTTVLHLGSSAVPSYVTVLPPALVSQKFDEMAGLMVRLIDENEIQSRTLSTLRDALLPKLVGGEVRVDRTQSIQPII